MANIGYARVSTADQNMALQLDALKQAGVEKVFRDQGCERVADGTTSLDRCLEHLRKAMSSSSGSWTARPQHPARTCRNRRADLTRRRLPQHHRWPAHRRGYGQGDADHHGCLRGVRARHDD